VTGATGPLLAPRLPASSADLAARLRRTRTLTAIRHLHADHAIEEILVDFPAEQALIERHGLRPRTLDK
jgi:hypothetical protein